MADNNKTDYNKAFMDLVKLLPEPLQSDVNISLFNNVFNRYLSKPETEKVSGYIGEGNANAIVSRQIHEKTVHRQAFQLQPVPYAKVGSVEHMASWKDIQNELTRLGVDMDDFAQWGATQKFNWVPPIDINKIINYRDYYWVGSTTPQYITIRSTCTAATARLNFWENLIQEFGSTFPVEEIGESDAVTTDYVIASLSPSTIVITGDATNDISSGDFVNVESTASNNGVHQVSADPVYDGSTNRTTLTVSTTVVTETPPVSARLTLRRFDKIVVGDNGIGLNGDYTELFVEGFVFFYRSSPNAELNNSFLETLSSSYDTDTRQTTITIRTAVTDNTTGGSPSELLSLEEQQSVYQADESCQCGDFGGWDIGLWDDNPLDPLWGDSETAAGSPGSDGISDHTNLIDRISNPAPPPASGTDGELWYDTIADTLYQYRVGSPSAWFTIWNNFSLILDQTNGFILWDMALECDTRPRIDATRQWSDENLWFHKNDVTNFVAATRAVQPIIEYDWDLELNEWSYTNYLWSYRSESDDTFVETDVNPPLIELEPLIWWENDTGNTITFDDRYGDLTDYFIEGRTVFVNTDTVTTQLTVESSEYKSSPSTHPYRTFVTFTTLPPVTSASLSSATPSRFTITPTETINGDSWDDYGVHWLFVGADDPQPVPHQSINPYIDISTAAPVTQVYSEASPSVLLHEYTTSLFSQNYYLVAAGQTSFALTSIVPSNTTRPLTRRALYGFNDIRVYSSDAVGEDVEREYGTFDELGETVFRVVDIDYDNNEFILGGADQQLIGVDFVGSGYFNAGDIIRLEENTGVGTQEFEVSSATPTAINRIPVRNTSSPTDELIEGIVYPDGILSNVTTPVPVDDFVNSRNVIQYTTGVEFFTARTAATNVQIVVGESAIRELGNYIRHVRTIEDEAQYNIVGDIPIGTIKYRWVDQLKTKNNQYPLFDVFTVLGEPAYQVSSIFGYRTSGEEEINQQTGLRIVYDEVNDIYSFDQFLLEEDNGELLAYRDYNNMENDYWYNFETQEVMFWDEITWTNKIDMSGHYRKAVVSSTEPSSPEADIDGLYWYNTVTNILYVRDTSVPTWVEVQGVDRGVSDVNLQTIWKSSDTNNQYIPAQVDWKNRTEAEYNTERDEFIVTRTEELLATDPDLSEPDAILQATQEWYDSQVNHLSSDGAWVGDWEIPDPLYYNHLHENKKYLTSRELLGHFTTIIESQSDTPGFSGSKSGLFNIIPINDVNYAAGGTIKEFNNGFDTLISSTFVNNVTPRSLIEFAHDQYESSLNTIKELFRADALDLLTNLEVDNILDLSSYVADEVINAYELNDLAAFLYGDSTTFIDNDGVNDLGVRNWIATLPFLKLVFKVVPERIFDGTLGLDEVAHHDGHREAYAVTDATKDVIARSLLDIEDPRTDGDPLAVGDASLPPNNVTEFTTEFNSIVGREGVYWYNSITNILYRYIVVASSEDEPSDAYPDGTLWMDLTGGSETLRIKNTDFNGDVSWDIVTGLSLGDGRLHNGINPLDLSTATISAWQEVDLSTILNDIIYELESRLYAAAPLPPSLNYNFDDTAAEYPTKYAQYLNEAFLDYVSQSEIEAPFENIDFLSTDPFTWNYKRSANNGSVTIVDADDTTNSFVVTGDRRGFFDPCTASAVCPSIVEFYVKNSLLNDGTWATIESTVSRPATSYNPGDNTTTIYVDADVRDDVRGVIYSGTLPSSENDGSESGGYWKDLYEKFYGTPYPHREPWVLQGYVSKPSWWDAEYLNDDIAQWGNRVWKYKHGFAITNADDVNQTFTISGDYHETFLSLGSGALPSDYSFSVDNSTEHAGDYNVRELDVIQTVNPDAAGFANFVVDDTSGFASSTYTVGMIISVATPGLTTLDVILNSYTIKSLSLVGTDLTIVVEEEIGVGDITAGTDFISGAVFTPSTNTTTIFVDGLGSPAVTPITSNVISGRIVETIGMWENIRTGLIPAGEVYPNGLTSVTGNPSTDRSVHGLSVPDLPTYNYFSVNIDNVSVSDNGTTFYSPDDILPPYWDYREQYTATPAGMDIPVRSLYFDFSTEIISPNADYIFGDAGPVEWDWRSSSQYLYDQLTVAYRLDPANFIYRTFGFNFTSIGGLLIDRDVKNTASHSRTNFHGDVVNNEQFISEGLNQWYVNFNRYEGFDANFSDFQPIWINWTAPLTYQFTSFVDTPSLDVGHRYIDLTNFDYNVTSKRSPAAADYWLDAFKVQIINIPYDISRYDNQLDWRFDVRTNLSISREITYYDVHNYQFYADPATDEMKLYTWEIVELNTVDNTFTIAGDQKDIFAAGRQFEISGSTGNDGTYTIFASTYDSVTDLTTIEIEGLIPDFRDDGLLTLIYRNLPWDTGYGVYLSTSELLPFPLDGDTIIGLTKYFIVKTSDTTFKLARTEADAYANNVIDLTTTGVGDHFVGDVLNTFVVDTVPSINWRQYAIDKTNVLTWSTPKQVQGMQPFVDFIRGYDSYEEENGWLINADRTLRDPDTGDIISWQVELERFIAYAYATRTRRNSINDRYPVTVDDATNEWTFLEDTTNFITGDPIIVLSSNTIYPNPISRGIRYYMIRDSIETFKLAASRVDALEGVAIDILPTAGVGDLAILAPTDAKHLIPAFEMNAFRNSIWFQPDFGIVSNIITGPTTDVRTSQLIFDQDGNALGTDQLRVYRQDKETKIVVVNGDTTPNNIFVSDVYNQLHLGGIHLFVDTYEHVMLFNNYSAGGDLLYDPFIGLNVTKYEMLFNRNPEDTRRPNVGGYYLQTFFNQNADIKENFEAGVDSLRNAYDTYRTFESDLMTEQSRKTLGYQGTVEYLDNINMSEKSQFLFWRGQIQSKGSVNAVKAYVNSRRFVDAKIDDFWAVKVGSFGSMGEKEFPEMFTKTIDARSNEFKAEFIDNDVDESIVDEGFTAIKMSDTDRWYNQPDQEEILRNNGRVLYFDMKPISKVNDLNSGSPDNRIITNNGKNYIVHGLDVDVVEMTMTGSPSTGFEEGTDYVYVNPYVVEILNSYLWNNIEDLTIWGYVANNDAQNPARIMDRKAEVRLSNIEYWDPARGLHYSNGIHNVDLQNNNDPAVYNNTIQTITDTRLWVGDKAGTSWLDTSAMFYVPYHSDKVITDSDIRFREWGQLHDFARIKIYEWVESDVPPEEWDALAEDEEGDNTIEESIRKSGRAKFTLFEPAGAGSPTDWIPLKDKVNVQYAATDATSYVTFTPDTGILDNTKAITVYINETNYSTVEPTGSPAVLPTTVTLPTKENDIVKFVQAVPTDEDEIAAEIAAGNLRQEYEYVTTEEVDELGNVTTTYYFWVEDKGTRPSGRNRTLSAADSQVDMVTMPTAHMFYQKPATVSSTTETGNLVNRVEYFDQPSVGSPLTHSYVVELEVLEGSTVLVEINGEDIAPELVSYVTVGGVTTVTVDVPVTGSPPEDRVKITYTGLYDSITALPYRFTQVIIRGLQGIVFSDSRYTIQFTRDFTLRDDLDIVNEALEPLELKNLHEEWQLIRQEQTNNIERWLWDRVTECIVGYKLDDTSTRVPSLDRELYDEKNDTDTQYGLGDGQAFADGTLALASVLAYLLDPDVDFTPVDINTFFEIYSFDTDENIIEAMNAIYDTFNFAHVNRIFFSVLHDAFTTKSKYPDIFKTSMVSLHGIRPFQTAGVFDD